MYLCSIPCEGGAYLNFSIKAGETIFLLGANGTGKSSLMHRFYSTHYSNARRITAHRQTWFESNAITVSPQQRQQVENSTKGYDNSPQSRWQDVYASSRTSVAIYDLVDGENIRARGIASAFDSEDLELAKELREKDLYLVVL